MPGIRQLGWTSHRLRGRGKVGRSKPSAVVRRLQNSEVFRHWWTWDQTLSHTSSVWLGLVISPSWVGLSVLTG
jgi:hypothetical protein